MDAFELQKIVKDLVDFFDDGHRCGNKECEKCNLLEKAKKASEEKISLRNRKI